MTRVPLCLAAGAATLTLLGCGKAIEAPYDQGVCYAVERGAEGEPPAFNKLAENQPQIEFCAARLEEMRLRFLRMGGTNQEITGAYQGRFVFVDREGVKIGQSLNGSRFFAMARTGDGRLAIPGAIARDDTGRPVAVAPAPEGQ